MVTVDRVLPWRRDPRPSVEEIDPILDRFRERGSRNKVDLIVRAYELAVAAHAGQSRKSGEGYIHHPVRVARIVAELGLDEVAIAAALLHDVVEDTELTLEELERQFSSDVASIVDGLTKLERIHFDSREAQQAASMRKLFIAITKDLRVLVIKLADRLHNMRTLGSMPLEKQQRIATETRDVYAPLAHRLGMEEMKVELEDLAFAATNPGMYAEIDHMLSERAPERDLYLTQVVEEVRQKLAAMNIDATVTGRPKHLWSIYEKMVVKSTTFEGIYDLVGLRVIVGSVRDCYGALGTIHAEWKPVQGRFKDMIAMPKFNSYQSLHTTVIGPSNKQIEFQIRTADMHARAEVGVAAHWRYKDDKALDADTGLEWLNRIVDWQTDSSDPIEFMDDLRADLEEDEVVVFSPKGKVVTLPAGSTPIDFAYLIHSEIGHACIGAKFDGVLADLSSSLNAGDTVEIITSHSPDASPSRSWLDIAVTPRARQQIRLKLSREERKDTTDAGREELGRRLQREGVPSSVLDSPTVIDQAASGAGVADAEALFIGIGEGQIDAENVAVRVAGLLRDSAPDRSEQLATTAVRPRSANMERPGVGVHVEGLDDVLVRISLCCTPVPHDEIIGFHTRGRGVSVHRADCAVAASSASERFDRLVDVEWDAEIAGRFVASVSVEALDRPRLLGDVSTAMADHHLNIIGCTLTTGSDRVCRMQFSIEMGDASHLESVLRMISGIEGVFSAERTLAS